VPLPQLDDDQVRTWTRIEKDRWWLANVFRGDMPQLTLRAAVTGFVLGGVLSATNLYVGAKTGWSLGVGVTSVILAFVAFRVATSLRVARPFTILENNAVQSIATAAGYMTAPLTSSLASYMVVTNAVLPWWKIFCWNLVISVLGVLMAFPMKRRFINEEQQPFPEGRACAVVLDSLYPGAPGGGEAAANAPSEPQAVDPHRIWLGDLKAKALFGAAAIAAFVEFAKVEAFHVLIQNRILHVPVEKVVHLPDKLLGWYWSLTDKIKWLPHTVLGTDARQLALDPTLDISMFGAGGLTGTRVANSLLLGALLNWAVLAPWMIRIGEIHPQADGSFGRGHILNSWSLWWGVSIMVAGSLTGLFGKPELILGAVRGLFKREAAGEDPVAHIELPLWVSYVGMPIVGAIAVALNYAWFGINPLLGALAIPMILVLTLIAANATALTSTTPTGSLSKITQFTFGALDHAHPATNLITAGMTAEAASNASNLLMDIKPGYMLGARPRQQAFGHLLGIVSGGIASTMLFFVLFLPKYDATLPLKPQLTRDYPFPSVDLWVGVSKLISDGAAHLPKTALASMIIAAALGVAFEIARIRTRGRFPLSPVAIGLGVVIPVDSTFMMWAGALFFWLLERRYATQPKTSVAHGLWVESVEPIAAGLVAGAALTGILGQVTKVFVLDGWWAIAKEAAH
jgi:uncharacterized oligopeptide transporter (OPT) family protein